MGEARRRLHSSSTNTHEMVDLKRRERKCARLNEAVVTWPRSEGTYISAGRLAELTERMETITAEWGDKPAPKDPKDRKAVFTRYIGVRGVGA